MKLFLSLALAAVLCSPAQGADEKKPDAAAQFKKLDANSDGKLSKEEFVGKRKADKADKAGKTFAKKDKNKDGSLSLEEFSAGMKKKDK
jgi:Ca2+-binding EF-hand superfamily protein